MCAGEKAHRGKPVAIFFNAIDCGLTTGGRENSRKLRTMLSTASGNFITMDAPSFSNNQGYAVYRFPTKYANETVTVTITFVIGGQEVEGLWFDSANLRKVSQ